MTNDYLANHTTTNKAPTRPAAAIDEGEGRVMSRIDWRKARKFHGSESARTDQPPLPPRDSLERRANSAALRWLKRQPIEIQEEFDGPVK